MTKHILFDTLFYCPFCGNKFDFDQGDDMKYCQHVQFGYVSGVDPEFFTYVSEGFGRAYITKLREGTRYKEYLEENEVSISTEEEESFAQAEFRAGDRISQVVPFFEDFAVSICSDNSIIFEANTTYGGFVLAVDGRV